MRLIGFSQRRPSHETDQRRLLDWIAEGHGQAEATLRGLGREAQDAFSAHVRKVLARCGCGPDKIRSRAHVIRDVGVPWDETEIYNLQRSPHGAGTYARTRLFEREVAAYFATEYAPEETPPSDILHVTCTGYVSPSGAQQLVAQRGWGDRTRVTHVYHMGCYAAFPALRMAAGALSLPCTLAAATPPRVDIVHTELCSLHFDPSAHTIEQLVVQSLFADGFIRYSLVPGELGPGIRVLALDERVLPASGAAMTWMASDYGMQMTLASNVPELIAGSARGFVLELFERAKLDAASELPNTVFAVHPGGPKIIDRVRDVFELDEAQVQVSRAVLADHGNMSSATLPHVWARLAAEPDVPPGTLIASLAFGPGLTIAGALLQKQ